MPPRRPQLKPALRRLWRDNQTLQFGLDATHAVIIGGLDEPAARLVESLDGTSDLAGVLSSAADLGLDPPRVEALLQLLDRSGVLDDAAADRQGLGALAQSERERLAPDLAAASIARGGADGGATVLARRRTSSVEVYGAGRVGAGICSLLAAAGVGTVVAHDSAPTTAADVSPAGAATSEVGVPRADAAGLAARRSAPGVRTRLARGRQRADLVVLAPVHGGSGDLPDQLLRQGVAHLFAVVRETTGVVGPLVLPGRSSCHRCHDLHRAERDPAWPRVAVQLGSVTARRDGPCDVALATMVAAEAVLQVLAQLDGDTPPAVDGTIEIDQADGLVRRRSWSRHPLCGCGWSGD